MHFFGSCFADHTHKFAAGGAPDDRIVHQDNSFASQSFSSSIILNFRAEIAYGLPGFDERPADIMASDEP